MSYTDDTKPYIYRQNYAKAIEFSESTSSNIFAWFKNIKIRNKKLHGSGSYLLIITKIWIAINSQKQAKEYSSNKNDLQSSLENSNHTILNELNSKLAFVQPIVSEEFIYIKKSLQEINDLYQRNENTSTYTNALIKHIDDLKKENKMKNLIQSLVEHNNAVFW